jgi:hypothetical protein
MEGTSWKTPLGAQPLLLELLKEKHSHSKLLDSLPKTLETAQSMSIERKAY